MAVEAKRGCGHRKINGLYLCGDGPTEPCDRLPFPLDVCPTCHTGIKQTRGWTWIDAPALFGGVHVIEKGTQPWQCMDLREGCMVCDPVAHLSGEHKVGLLWIGEQFYKSPAAFLKEAREMGVSRRITAVPRNFKVGETVVMFAHPKALSRVEVNQEALTDYGDVVAEGRISAKDAEDACRETVYTPGIFQVFKPNRIEKILKESDATPEAKAELAQKGITVVTVPDGDKDHQGSVYDDEEPAQATLC